ncbi:MAG: hypothetical protein K2W95_23625 [Candidatus Obscuribacterales bacterium]|nr:hypothetical protein [Candidatus Obscuribacterales bacterium]
MVSIRDDWRACAELTLTDLERQNMSHLNPSVQEIDSPKELAALRAAIESEYVAIHSVVDTHLIASDSRGCNEIRSDIDRCREQLRAINARYEALSKPTLPVEKPYCNRLHAELARLQQPLSARLSELEQELRKAQKELARTKAGYRRIDMSFMSRRKWSAKYECGLPLFAMFCTSNSHCYLQAHADSEDGHIRQRVSSVPYDSIFLQPEVRAYLSQLACAPLDNDRERKVTVSAEFAGAIPPCVRAEICSAKHMFDEVRIVTESPDWQIDTLEIDCGDERTEFELKPLPTPESMVLVVGKTDDRFWLIAVFHSGAVETLSC